MVPALHGGSRPPSGPRAAAVLADAAALPFGAGTFDLVVAYMSLHDMDRMPEAVAEAARVLERGGRLVVAIPHPVNSAGSFHGPAWERPVRDRGLLPRPAPRRLGGRRGGIAMTFHSEHRPLEAYSRALETAGLLIEAIRDKPAVPAGVVADTPGKRRWQRIPLLLHMVRQNTGKVLWHGRAVTRYHGAVCAYRVSNESRQESSACPSTSRTQLAVRPGGDGAGTAPARAGAVLCCADPGWPLRNGMKPGFQHARACWKPGVHHPSPAPARPQPPCNSGLPTAQCLAAAALTPSMNNSMPSR